MRGVPDNETDTRQRLLDAAGKIFAENGLQKATVREICQAANANIAAVNYHFGDKEGLYAAVLAVAHCKADESCPVEIDPGSSPEEKLRTFVHTFQLRLFDPTRPAWQGLLIARELFEPTAALDQLLETSIRPRHEMLRAIVRELLGGNADEATVRRCAHSVVGQCLFYHHAKPLITRLEPEGAPRNIDVEALTEHILAFSLGGIRCLMNRLNGVGD